MKFILLLSLLCALCACQTHRIRHTSQRDSSYRQTAETTKQIRNANTQSVQLDWQQWLADSTAVVILPKGPVSYHPNNGFKGEATAILSYGTHIRYTELQRDHKTDQTEERSSASDYTLVTQTHAKERTSETDRQPATGYSFRWLAIALATACLLFLLRRYDNRRNR